MHACICSRVQLAVATERERGAHHARALLAAQHAQLQGAMAAAVAELQADLAAAAREDRDALRQQHQRDVQVGRGRGGGRLWWPRRWRWWSR